MMKKGCFYLVFFCIAFNSVTARSYVKTDTLSNILLIKDKIPREKQLVRYFRNYFSSTPVNSLYDSKIEMVSVLNKNNIASKEALSYLVESLYQGKLSHTDQSKTAIINAIQAAEKSNDDYLSCTFLNYLAYKQTEEGNVIGAVSSYRMAKKDAIKLNDTNLQMIIDINISDVYYKNNFFSKSLFFLNQAEILNAKFWPDDQRIKNIIYYNKSENFFRMNMPDSLQVYNEKLKKSKANTYKLYTYKNRTDYYLYLLRHDYKNAIKLIHAMQNDEGNKFDDNDRQNLSDAFYKDGQLDSAKLIITQLLSESSASNHPEIKYHLYEVLGEIAEQQGDFKSSSDYFKLSLQQSKVNMNRLTQVDNISSLIKVDELEGIYAQKKESYEKERLWLILTVVCALLAILVIAMFYRAIKQKRHYERLLFRAKKNELAFINSHDVRKHLTNILGLIDVVRHGKDKEKEYLQVEDRLFCSAEGLDKAIKNISEKLDD